MNEHSRGGQSAPLVEGLSDRSITEYSGTALAQAGIRGVGSVPPLTARVRAFGTILVIKARGSGSEIERRPLRPGLPTIDIIFVERGTVEYLEGGSWHTASGSLMIAPSGLPLRARFRGDWEFIVARVPRDALLPYVPSLEDSVGIHGDLTMPERAMLAFLTQSVTDEHEVSEAESSTVNRQVLEMAGTLVLGRRGRGLAHDTPRGVLRQRALAVIAARSGDVTLTPESLAAAVNTSLRRLQEVFADSDSSVGGEIRRERARIARSLLQDPRFDDLDTGSIAASSGFGSSASMRRALEALYGFTPRKLRARR